jgi:peptidoglycan L-alanyl-D-glutamate endopeptidase CwlK
MRSVAEQRKLVQDGKSQTMNSKHIDHDNDGDSEAVDIVVYVEGRVSWDIGYYGMVAEAFRQASIDLDVELRWGGSWTVLNKEHSASQAYTNYLDRKQKEGKVPFVDGMHFELYRG